MFDTSPVYGSSSFGTQGTEMQAKPFKSTGLPGENKVIEDKSGGFINPNFGAPPPKTLDDSTDLYATVGGGPSRKTHSNA